MIAVFIVSFVTAFNDWNKEKQFRSLRSRIDEQRVTNVIRNGRMKEVNIRDLVVGDICHLKYGDLVPADGLVIHATDFFVDESSLTGESNLVEKDTDKNMIVLSGSFDCCFNFAFCMNFDR